MRSDVVSAKIAAGSGRANVVYIGTLGNLLTPGFGTAFVVAPPAVIERVISFRAPDHG